MKYFEVDFTITPLSEDAQDVLSALAAEAGFETFEQTEIGMKGYVQQALFNEDSLQQIIASFPFSDIKIAYQVIEAEDKDWNEQWEQEGFEPIIVANRLAIHDGRHLPTSDINLLPSSIDIEIDAHLAFGTGTHETTRMICGVLLDSELKKKRVLDCGCGTGILGICALKLGAEKCVGYDIDEWSSDNTRHNAVINQVDDRMTSLNGDATLLDSMIERFDVVMANINRNILLQDMPRFVSVMEPDATLILSGFYACDCKILENKANELGLKLKQTRSDNDWACMVFKRQ
jgi:ribosomal protein L11 methyltransferase